MTFQLIYLIIGLTLIVMGAEWLVAGSSTVARKSGISEFVIGLTIVGFGTSCPELVVSLTGAFQGNADVSIGNVIGSNIFNTLLILGISTLLSPIAVTDRNRRLDIPLTMGVSLLLVAFMYTSRSLTLIEGAIFLLLFITYIWYSFKTGKTGSDNDGQAESNKKTGTAVLLILIGLSGLIFGGRLFVDSAISIASMLGVSEKFIAITLLAGGTSLPELATSIVAASKGMDQLALGNILGSNVFNILLILGLSSLVTPLSSISLTAVDYIALSSSILLLMVSAYTGDKNRLDRWEGAILIIAFIAYYYWLFINA